MGRDDERGRGGRRERDGGGARRPRGDERGGGRGDRPRRTERPDRGGGEEHKVGPESERARAQRGERGGERAVAGRRHGGRQPAGQSSGGWVWIVVALIVIAVVVWFVFIR
jgi:hypothetical protein